MAERIVDWHSFVKNLQARSDEDLIRLEDLADTLMCPKCGSRDTKSPLGNNVICLSCDYEDHWSRFCHPEVQKMIDDAENELILREALE